MVPALSGSQQAARREAVVTNQDLVQHTERHHLIQRLASYASLNYKVTLPISGAGLPHAPMGVAAGALRAQHQLGGAATAQLLTAG